jgi:hypothetical protein
MSKEMTVIALGVLVAVTPYLGIPGSWKTVVLVLAGLCLAGAGFLLRGEALARTTGYGHNHFVENAAPTTPTRRDHGISSLN